MLASPSKHDLDLLKANPAVLHAVHNILMSEGDARLTASLGTIRTGGIDGAVDVANNIFRNLGWADAAMFLQAQIQESEQE